MRKVARNDITGAWIVSKPNNEQFEKNFELIFGKKKKKLEEVEYELDKSTGEVIKKQD
jgi:predicted small secreted protein